MCVLRLYCKILLILKTSSIIAGESRWICLYVSIAKIWTFLWCTEKERSWSRSFWNVYLKSKYTIRNAFSCTLLALLFGRLEWNIQIKGHELNWDSPNPFMRSLIQRHVTCNSEQNLYFLTDFIANACNACNVLSSELRTIPSYFSAAHGVRKTSLIFTFSVFLLLSKIWDFSWLPFMWLFSKHLNNLKLMILIPILQDV